MLYYDRIDISEVIDISKINSSKECNIFHYWYLLDKELKFQPYVCNGCHDLLIVSMNLSNIVILNINSVDNFYIINGISKSETVYLLQKMI